jgi:hypothetical protein
MARSKTKTCLQIEHFPEKLALGLDPRVAPVFRKKMRRDKKLERFPIPSNWKSALVALGVAALIGATAAQAQMRGNFDDADANHDGRVTLEEFRAYATNRLMAANGLMAQKFKGLSRKTKPRGCSSASRSSIAAARAISIAAIGAGRDVTPAVWLGVLRCARWRLPDIPAIARR